ncbi:hypothetical protein ES703_53942 [subsurface metagenome]
MLEWIKKNSTIITTVLVIIGVIIFVYGCEPKVRSLTDNTRLVNRQELQLELDQIIGIAQVRMVDLDKQDQLRAIILRNALVLVQGQPLDPFAIITGIAAIYGIITGGCNIKKVVKVQLDKRKATNG